MPTYSIATRDKDGQLKLRLRVYYSKDESGTGKPEQKYQDLPIIIPKSHYNKKLERVKGKNPKAKEYNLIIEKALNAKKEGKEVELKDKQKSLILFAERLITTKRKHNTKRGMQLALDKLKDYLKEIKKVDLEFREIDSFFTQNYYNYLKENYATSTANEYFRKFKGFKKVAVKQRMHQYDYDPFASVKLGRVDDKIDVLSLDELNKFLNKDYSNDLSKHYTQASFKFMMYAAGMRVSDLVIMKWKDFEVQDDKVLIRVGNKKTEYGFKTLLTVKAFESLRPFIETYKDISFVDYDKKYDHIQETKKRVNQLKDEYYSIETESFLEVFPKLIKTLPDETFIQHMYNMSHDEIQEKVKHQQEKENKKKILKTQIEAAIEWLEKEDTFLIRESSKVLAQLKDKYPEDRIFPKARTYSDSEFTDARINNLENNTNYHLKVIKKELKIKNPLTNHQARHVFAQKLFEAGATFHDVSLALGHKSLEATEKYRKQIITDKSREITKTFEDILHPDKVSAYLPSDEGFITQDGKRYKLIDENAFK